ncbi:hypothetical protein [Halobaculum lipolyticum]|uniref:DUF8052 domain-containing protein n=1 Tax=Halobaculum lipolyticum TaxID=3032001 RepID=A0ABD5WEW5_9EURY|nr:hypothetical protein [Halobaculum sp. DT31]
MADEGGQDDSSTRVGGGTDPATAASDGDDDGAAFRTDERGRIVDGAAYEDVPVWDDEYLDRVSDRLMFNYDLERDARFRGESFDLYASMRIDSQKEFFHPSLDYANHHSDEHLFARRVDRASVGELERLVELGHDLADEWVEGDEEHYGTDLSFVLVAEEVPDDVREFVVDFRERELLKYGYYGHYEIGLGVVAPGEERAVASREADVVSAFALWDDVPERKGHRGILSRLLGRLRG